jgi:hypothetical protein
MPLTIVRFVPVRPRCHLLLAWARRAHHLRDFAEYDTQVTILTQMPNFEHLRVRIFVEASSFKKTHSETCYAPDTNILYSHRRPRCHLVASARHCLLLCAHVFTICRGLGNCVGTTKLYCEELTLLFMVFGFLTSQLDCPCDTG